MMGGYRGYCDYCGSSYWDVKCRICGGLFEVCMCEFAKTVCDECEYDLGEDADCVEVVYPTTSLRGDGTDG